MCERILIENGAPTLANMKTASLFTLPILEEKSQFAWKKTLETKGIKIMVLRTKGKNQLIYMYRPEKLRQDLTNPMAACILCRAGYQYQTEKEALQILKKRIAQSSEFPHEIGLFLGYPPEDVQGFMENRGQNCKCVGCWKVYGNAEQAEKQFARYKKCRDVYMRLFSQGRTLTQLTVAS